MAISGIEIEKSKILQAIYDKKGNIEHAAQAIGCQPVTIYRHMKRDPEIEEALQEARSIREKERINQQECLKDAAYQSASKLLQRNDTTMAIFILKTLCGFTEKNISPVSQVVVRGSNDNNRPEQALPAQVVSETV